MYECQNYSEFNKIELDAYASEIARHFLEPVGAAEENPDARRAAFRR